MKVIEKIRMAATIVFVVAIALAVAYHQGICSWLMEQFTGSMESQLQQLLRWEAWMFQAESIQKIDLVYFLISSWRMTVM